MMSKEIDISTENYNQVLYRMRRLKVELNKLEDKEIIKNAYKFYDVWSNIIDSQEYLEKELLKFALNLIKDRDEERRKCQRVRGAG